MKNWNSVCFYNGDSISDLIDKTQKAIKIIECRESKIAIEECSDIKNGICKFNYSVWNYDLGEDTLFIESKVTFMDLFDYIKDNKLVVNTYPLREYIFDFTNDALKAYVLGKRNEGIFYETNNY